MTGVDLPDLIKRFRAQRPFVRRFVYALLVVLMLQSLAAMIDFSDGFARGFDNATHGVKYKP